MGLNHDHASAFGGRNCYWWLKLCGQSRYNFIFFSNQKFIRNSSEVHQKFIKELRCGCRTRPLFHPQYQNQARIGPDLLNRSPPFSGAPATDQAPIPAQKKTEKISQHYVGSLDQDGSGLATTGAQTDWPPKMLLG